MPATEQTWYDQKLLHVVFGVTSLIMLISVVWMIAQDHERPWKKHQREFRDMQRMQLGGRLRAEQKNQLEVVQQAELQYAAAQSEAPDASLVEQFKQISESELGMTSFARLDDDMAELTVQAGNAASSSQEFEGVQVKLREARSAVQNAADEAAREAANAAVQATQAQVETASDALASSQKAAQRLRSRVVNSMQSILGEAKFRMDESVGR